MSLEIFLIILEIVCSVLVAVTGFLGWKKNAGNLIHRTFLGMSALHFLWLLFDALNRLTVYTEFYITASMFRLSDWSLLGAGILFVYFGNIFPRRGRRGKMESAAAERRYRIFPLIVTLCAAAAVLAALSFTGLYVKDRQYNPVDGSYNGIQGPVYYLIRLFFIYCLIASAREQRKFIKNHERDPRRIHSRYFIYGTAAALLASALSALFSLFYFASAYLYPSFAIISVLFAYFMYSMLSYRAIALRSSIYRSTVTLAASVIVLLPAFFLINYLLAIIYTYSIWLMSAALCLSFLGFALLQRKLQPFLTQLIFKKQSKIDDAIASFSTSILNLASGKKTDVRKQLVEFLDELYSPRFLVFYSMETGEDGNTHLIQDRNLTRIADVDSIPPVAIPEELLEIFHNTGDVGRNGGLIVDLLAISEKQGLTQSVQTLSRFAAFGAEIILPFFDSSSDQEEGKGDETVQAVMALGLARNMRPFDHTDFRLLKNLRSPALLAMKNQELLLSTTRLQRKLEEENRKITRRLSGNLPGVMQGRSAAAFVFNRQGSMFRIMEQVEKFAGRDSPVLITGETGTGKEQIARILHGQSGRKGQLVTVNCSAIPGDLIENELFGHEKGAYTGALEASEGLVARAKNGTLFLDEIGEMPIAGQVKLLRLVQEGEYERIGSSETMRTDARFVFATNRDLEEEVNSGRFRSDLFYRISTFEIRLPPLRDRKDDILLLIDHFLWLAGQTFNRPALRMTAQARELLLKHTWPGNVRELENLILRTVVLSDTDELDVDSLPVMFRDELDFKRKQMQLDRVVNEMTRLEKELLLEALEKSGGNQRKAAEILNISRGSLQYRMKQYGLLQN